jgi:hypothetical protein
MSPQWLHWPAADVSATLIIHDDFTTAIDGSLSGRTPNIVDNGNTWTTYNGEAYTVQASSGTVFASNDGSDFSKATTLDCGATTYKIEALLSCADWSTSSCGVVFALTSGTDTSETFAKIDCSSGTFRCVEYSSGSASVTSLGSVTAGSGERWLDVEVSGTSYTATLFNLTRTVTVASGSGTLSIAPTPVVGLNLIAAGSGTPYCTELKIYT